MRTALRIVVRLEKRNTGFRFYALKRGKALGILGSIAYCIDNQSIGIHAEGKESVLEYYVSILRQGSPYSKILSIMSVPDRMLNSPYLEILPGKIPLVVAKIEMPSFIGFRSGLFGFHIFH